MMLENVLVSLISTYFSNFPYTTYLRNCLFSIEHSCLLCCRLIDHRCMGLFLGFLSCSIDLYFCFLLSGPYRFDNCRFLIQLEVRDLDFSSSIYLSQDCFGYSGYLVLPYKFRIFILVLRKMPLII